MIESKLSKTISKLALILISANLVLRGVLEFGLNDPWYTTIILTMDIFTGSTTFILYKLFSKHYSSQKWLVPTILTLLALFHNSLTYFPFYSQDFGQFDNIPLMTATFLAGAVNITAIIWNLVLIIRRDKHTHLERGSRLFLASLLLVLCNIFIVPIFQFLLETPHLSWLYIPNFLLQSTALLILFWSELKFEPMTPPDLRGQNEDDINFEFEEKQ